MDFGDIWGNLIWIIPLFYALKRMLFGPRKSEAAKEPSTREPRQPERQQVLVQNSRDELREALGEIGVALGFTDSVMQEEHSPQESVETADYLFGSSMPFDAERDRRRKADIDRATSLFPMDPAPEEVAEYDPWHERAVPETIYETDALFAEEEAFEARESDHIREHKDENQETAAEEPPPFERPKTSAHALWRLAARTPLQQAVIMKELLDRPVSLRWRSGLPFRT